LFREAIERGDFKITMKGHTDAEAAAVFGALRACVPGSPEYLEDARKNMDVGTLEWVAGQFQKYLSFAIENNQFDLGNFAESIAKARERLHGTEDELIAWLRALDVPVADDLTIEERVRTGVRRAYDRKKNGGAAAVLDDFLTRR
jgi:hypothetical protein